MEKMINPTQNQTPDQSRPNRLIIMPTAASSVMRPPSVVMKSATFEWRPPGSALELGFWARAKT